MTKYYLLILIGSFIASCAVSEEETEAHEFKIPELTSGNIQDSCFVEPSEGPFILGIDYVFGDSSAYYEDSVTVDLITEKMAAIDWKTFHIVWLEDKNGCSIDVSGSLYEDGLSSGYQKHSQSTGDFLCEMIIVDPPKDVDHMTEILLSFFNETEDWHQENKYE